MKITLKQADFDRICQHALEGAPDEACGLIAGEDREDGVREIKKVYLLTNMDHTKEHFTIDPGEQLKRAYKVVKEAQIAGLEQIIDGAEAANVDLAARMVIDSSEFKGTFIHSFGHGIGMDIHQPIYVSPNSKNTLKAGNVISAEPGIYIPGVGGIRIEDTVLVTEDGSRLLTHYDHDLTIV